MQITTKQTTEHTIDIQLPFFRARIGTTGNEYLAMIAEGYVIEVYETDDMTRVGVIPKWLKEKEIVNSYTTWEEISEAEFLKAHQEALDSLSLVPKLVNRPAANLDDLKSINI